MTRYSTILPALLILGSLVPLRTMQAAEAAVQAIEALRVEEMEVESLQERFAMLAATS